MIECLSYLRNELLFNGYVHAKVIPGTDLESDNQIFLFKIIYIINKWEYIMEFVLNSKFKPTGDQPEAIEKILL